MRHIICYTGSSYFNYFHIWWNNFFVKQIATILYKVESTQWRPGKDPKLLQIPRERNLNFEYARRLNDTLAF